MLSIACSRHDDSVTSLVSSPNSQWIASGSDDGTIILWDANGRVCQEWLVKHEGIRWLAFSPNGQRLSCADGSGKITIWNLSQVAFRVTTLKTPTSRFMNCSWSPDSTILASIARDGSLCLWDTETFQERLRTESLVDSPYGDPDETIGFSPNGRWLDRKSTRLNSSHSGESRMPSSA